MGIVQSILCSIIFCAERVLTWTCCAFLLMLLMFCIVSLMVYGISVGYHYAQKELASYALSSRPGKTGKLQEDADEQPAEHLVVVNITKPAGALQTGHEVLRTQTPSEVYMRGTETPIVVLQTESPSTEPQLTDHERELARRLIGRFRRSRNNTASSVVVSTDFFKPLRSLTSVTSALT